MDSNLERQYEENRAKMADCRRALDRIFWGMVLLGGILFVLALFASADVGRDPNVDGPNKFYIGFFAGFLQVLAAGVTIGFAFGIRAQKPLAMFFYGALTLLWMILSLLDLLRLSMGNFLFGAVGLTFCILSLRQYKTLSYLMDQPGYPLFSLRADTPAEYVPSANVLANQSIGHMDTIGGDAPSSAPAQMAGLPQTSAAELLSDMTAEPCHPDPRDVLPDSEEVRERLGHLDTLGGTDAPPSAPAQMAELPQVSAAELLSDMTAEPRHSDPRDALPDPEEVRERLRQMQAERTQPPQGEPKSL